MLRGLDNLKIAHTLDAHSGTISDLDASGHTLITCGFSQRPGYVFLLFQALQRLIIYCTYIVREINSFNV